MHEDPRRSWRFPVLPEHKDAELRVGDTGIVMAMDLAVNAAGNLNHDGDVDDALETQYGALAKDVFAAINEEGLL